MSDWEQEILENRKSHKWESKILPEDMWDKDFYIKKRTKFVGLRPRNIKVGKEDIALGQEGLGLRKENSRLGTKD